MKLFSIYFCLVSALIATRASAADAPATFKVSEFTFTRPASWEWVPATSAMRKAEMKVVDANTKAAAEVVFFYFGPGNGGGTQANVDRWLGQFQEPRDQIQAKVDSATVGRHKVTYVSAAGTYKSGMPGGPQTPNPGYALLGAIIEAEQGSVFVKMTGPKETTEPATGAFKKMVEEALK